MAGFQLSGKSAQTGLSGGAVSTPISTGATYAPQNGINPTYLIIGLVVIATFYFRRKGG